MKTEDIKTWQHRLPPKQSDEPVLWREESKARQEEIDELRAVLKERDVEIAKLSADVQTWTNSGWVRACDEEMVATHLGVANLSDSYALAKAKLNMLICWHVAAATDPAVNGGYQLVPVAERDAKLAALEVQEPVAGTIKIGDKILAAPSGSCSTTHFVTINVISNSRAVAPVVNQHTRLHYLKGSDAIATFGALSDLFSGECQESSRVNKPNLYAAAGAAPVPTGHRLVSVEALTKWRNAFAEELSAWDIDPPLHHVQTSHDEISTMLEASKEST